MKGIDAHTDSLYATKESHVIDKKEKVQSTSKPDSNQEEARTNKHEKEPRFYT